MTRNPLLKRRDAPPQLRRVRFSVPEAEARALDALMERARAAGFDVDLEAALGEAYGRIAQKLARELSKDPEAVAAPAPSPQPATPGGPGAYAAE